MEGFDMYNFPPFFTRQRNQETESQRKDDWVKWIVMWAKKNQKTEIIVEKELSSDLFCNNNINRKLDLDHAVEICDYLAMKGNGEWVGESKTNFLILYKSKAEWARLLFDWVDSSGQMGSVFTVYELLEGDETEKQEFHGMDRNLFIKVLEHMEAQGEAKIFTASDPTKIGVKIFK